jgi:hypothetical protein
MSTSNLEGWLEKKGAGGGPLGRSFKKRWCVVKENKMFYYKSAQVLVKIMIAIVN